MINVALMNNFLETCDPISYTNAQGQLEWDQAMQIEMIF
jgi:hypothetical protein